MDGLPGRGCGPARLRATIVPRLPAVGADGRYSDGEVSHDDRTRRQDRHGFRVPREVVEALDSGKKPRVHVTIGGHSYRSTVAVYGGEFMLPLSAENRTSAGFVAGDEVDVDLELDTEPREVAVPADLASALQADPDVSRRFDDLSYSKRRQYVTRITDAKTSETQQRRIARTIDELRES